MSIKILLFASGAALLTACGGGGGGAAAPSSTLLATPAISIADSAIAEGDGGTAAMGFTVTLNAAGTSDVTVDYKTAGVSASAGTDYVTASGTLTIPAGATSAQFSVDVNGDVDIETDEAFSVTLSAPVNAALSNSAATGTIINDDFPVVSLSPAQVIEGDSGETDMSFTVSLDAPGIGDIRLDYATSNVNSGADAGIDYVQTSGMLVIAEGDTTATISVPVNGDVRVEKDEMFTLSLTNLSANALLGTDQALGVILDDDQPALSISSNSIVEGNSGARTLNFVVSLDEAGDGVSFDYVTADGDATVADDDYDAAGGTITIPAGSASASIPVVINGDSDAEPSETFSVVLSNLVGDAVLREATASGTIIDDDTPPTSSQISVGGKVLIEGDAGSATDMVFAVVVEPPSTSNVVIDYETVAGSAADPDDYNTASGRITVPAGSSSETFTVTVNGDDENEDLETFTLNLEYIFGDAVLKTPTATGFIVDDDGVQALGLSVAGARIFEGDSGVTNMVFEAVLSEPSASEVTVDYATEDVADSAVAGSDYAPVSGTLSIPAGELLANITVPVVGDSVIEADEMFRLGLSNIGGGAVLVNSIAIGDILTDDPLAEITVDDVGIAEGDSGSTDLVFTVSLSAQAGDNVVMNYATTDDSAETADNDYTPVSGTLVIPPGDTNGSIAVRVNGDIEAEDDQRFLLTLSNASANAQIVDGEAFGAIINDDGDAGWRGEELVRQDRTDSSMAHLRAYQPQVAFGPGGTLRAIWLERTTQLHSSESSAPGIWSTPEQVATNGHSSYAAHLFVDDAARMLAAWPTRTNPHFNTYAPGTGWDAPDELATTDVVTSLRVPLAGDPATGEVFAIWNESSSSAANGLTTMWASRYLPGTGWQETAPIDSVNQSANATDVAADANGGALMVGLLGGDVVAYRYDPQTNDWNGPEVLSDAADGGTGHPALAMDAAGNAAVVWSQGVNVSGTGIRANRYVVGTGWSGSELVDQGALFVNRSYDPEVAIDAAGNVFVIWLRTDQAAGRGSPDLWTRRFDTSLPTPDWDMPRLLEFDDTSDSIVAISEAQILADDAGNAIAVWGQDNGSFRDLRGARYSISDRDWGPAELLEELEAASGVDLAMDRVTGNAAVVWSTGRPDPFWGSTISAIDIWINRYTAP